MALRVAIATGNWSNPAIWNDGVLPRVDDIVASNGYTVTIDQNITVDSLTNAVASPIILTAQMTSNIAPSGIASSSTAIGGYDPFKAFDRIESSSEWLTSGTTIGWLAYEFPSTKIVAKYILVPPANQSPTSIPRDWTFEGWTGSVWVVLDTVTGNSGTANVTRTFANTTAYIKYRINITLNNGFGSYTGIRELYLYGPNDYGTNSVAGGGFVVTSTQTITCTSALGIQPGSTTALTVSASSPSTVTVNSNLTMSGTGTSVNCISKTGTCTLNVTGSIFYGGSGNSRHGLVIYSTGTTNFVGGVRGFWQGSYGIWLTTGSAGAVLNITGNINPDKTLGTAQNEYPLVISTICTVNITGNIYGSYGAASLTVSIAAAASVYVTGNVYGGAGSPGISCGGNASYLSIIGTIYAQHTTGYEAAGVVSTSTSAINLFSGPFVSSPYGAFPLQCYRMHLIPSTSNYFEFRDETTNGALSPGAIAPATRMIAPAGVSDSPIPANVRYGTVYANGSLTGTCKIPSVNSVAYGVQVDNTYGAAVLTPQNVWDYLISNLNTSGSIGERLKKAATVDSTGAQLSSFEF